MITVDAIDFGTAETKCATVDGTGQPIIVPNTRGEHTTASAVYVPRSGEPLIGTDALQQGALEPKRVAQHFKLQLGSAESVVTDGEFSATDAAAAVIGYVQRSAQAHLGRTVTNAAVTCPANFRDDQKRALLDAFERNGIRVVALIPEPTAAGYAYAVQKLGQRCTLLVYDFGGGTFDVSVVRVENGVFTVLATDGVPHLGGRDFTTRIVELVMKDVAKTSGGAPDPEREALLFLELGQKAEQAKVSLSSQSEVPIVVAHRGKQVITRITAQAYQAAIEPLIRQSLDATDRAVAAAGLKFADIDRLIAVGGTSRSPFVQKLLAEHTGLVPKVDVDPSKAIVYGAALAGVAELAREGQRATWQGQVIPAPELFIREVTAHDVGCCVVDSGRSGKALRLAVIIPKNTPIPTRLCESFFLERDDITEARVEILQGQANALSSECLTIGVISLDNLPREATRTQRIQVEYAIDRNGMVTATATDRVSGSSQTVSVEYKRDSSAQRQPAAA